VASEEVQSATEANIFDSIERGGVRDGRNLAAPMVLGDGGGTNALQPENDHENRWFEQGPRVLIQNQHIIRAENKSGQKYSMEAEPRGSMARVPHLFAGPPVDMHGEEGEDDVDQDRHPEQEQRRREPDHTKAGGGWAVENVAGSRLVQLVGDSGSFPGCVCGVHAAVETETAGVTYPKAPMAGNMTEQS